jgi:AraC-like DNA-binding protein
MHTRSEAPSSLLVTRRTEIAFYLQTFQERHGLRVAGASPQVARVLECLQARLFEESLNVKTLRNDCGLRDHNVSCRFKCEVGISITEYIEGGRLRAALALLRSDSLGTPEIARSVGYAHLQSFHRAFVRRFGCTPGDVRRGLHASADELSACPPNDSPDACRRGHCGEEMLRQDVHALPFAIHF